MRLKILSIAVVFSILLASSGIAVAAKKSNRGQCKRLTKQLSVYAESMNQARVGNNALWARSLDEQMARKYARRHRLCPDIAQEQAFWRARAAYEQTKQFLASAGKAALKYFTMGAY